MSVTVFLPAVLARLAGNQRSLAVDGGTVGEVVNTAAQQFPDLAPRLKDEQGEPYAFVTYYLNDDDIRLRDGFATEVADGDELTIVPAIAGG
jgi:molybdopterin synthase sulfur carrier subunit